MQVHLEYVLISQQNYSTIRLSFNDDGDLRIEQDGDAVLVNPGEIDEFAQMLTQFVRNEKKPTG